MSKVRLTYSGISYFTAQIIAYLIGYIYPIYVARLLPKYEYGLYGFIISILTMTMIFGEAIPRWASRMIARGGRYVKTAINTNLIISIPVSIIFTLIIYYTTEIKPIYLNFIILISLIYTPIYYILLTLRHYILMKKTEKLGYEQLITSIIKITLGIALVYIIGLYGALITIVIGLTITSIYFYKKAGEDKEEKIDYTIVKEWLKGSWFMILVSLAYNLYRFIPIIFLGFINEFISLSSYTVATKVAGWIMLTSGLSIALTPKLLRESLDMHNVYRSLSLVLLFATPMLVGIQILNKEIVYVFGIKKYVDAAIPLTILSLASYLNIFTATGISTVYGIERFDEKFRINIRALLKSKLIHILIMRYLAVGVLAILIFTLYSPLKIIGLAYATLGASTIQFLYMGILVLKNINLIDLLKKISKYILCSIIMAIIIYPIPKPRSLIIGASIFIGAIIYFTTLYLIDKEFRILVKKGRNEILKIISGLYQL